MARGGQGNERAGARRVFDVTLETFGQADEIANPVAAAHLEFGRGGAGAPQHGVVVHRGDECLGENPRSAGRVREVGVEAWMVPVRGRGNDQPIEVGQDGVHRFAVLRRVRGKRGGHVTGRHRRQHAAFFDAGDEIGDPIGHRVGVAAQFVGMHVARAIGHGGLRRVADGLLRW